MVDELRLAEGLLDRDGVRRRLFSRRARLIGSLAAAVSVSFGAGWLLRESGERRATREAIQLSAEDARDLSGGGVTLNAGKKAVSERFVEARKEMLERFHFTEAQHQFMQLIKSKDAPQPTENWARFNAALCDIMRDKKDAAQEQFEKLSSGPEVNGLAPFFAKVKERMAKNFGLGTPLESLGYQTSNEEILGYLLHGLAEWHFGDALLGAEELEYFQEHLSHVTQASAGGTAAAAASPEWLFLYGSLVDHYKPDFALVRRALKPRSSENIADLQAALEEVRQTKARLKTSGAFRSMIGRWESALNSEISRMRVEVQERRILEDRKRRQADLELLAEVNAVVPSLVQGYDYTRAIEMLSGTRLETDDVRQALDSRIYLYTESRDFVRQVAADLAAKGWTGTVSRREGGQLTGRITCSADGALVNVVLERGTISLPFDSLTPESLVEMAQAFNAQVTDSTDFYHRQEIIAAFARLNGLTQLSATIAAQLMEENRSFRTRWMKVMETGI